MKEIDRGSASAHRLRALRATIALGLLTLLGILVVAACTTPVSNQTLTVSLAGTGAGTVTSSPAGIDCAADCTHAFVQGTTVTLTATPLGGSTFQGWSGACEAAASTCTVTMAEARAVTATFRAPEAKDLACEPVHEGAAGPTLVCTLADERVVVEVPWQGSVLLVRSLPIEGLGYLPNDNDFEPLSLWPLVRLGIVDAVNEQPVVAFDPVLRLTVRYGASEFDVADPAVGMGELGLGIWDEGVETWIVAGHGVFHEGFWLADPIGGGDLVLQGDPSAGQPRFAMKGTPTAGEAVALIAATPPTLPLTWGAMPFDPDHMLKEFDSCADILVDGVPAVECVAAMMGVTVRVPVQQGGTVTPRVIALPWNKSTTFDGASNRLSPSQGPELEVDRLMNFLVVDAAEPTRYLETFDPPLEFEIAYAPGDVDPNIHPYFAVVYWDEYVERFVTFGDGWPVEGECYPDAYYDEESDTFVYGDPAPACLWGVPATGTPGTVATDPEFENNFFRWNEDVATGGVARFTYDIWGDRLIALMK